MPDVRQTRETPRDRRSRERPARQRNAEGIVGCHVLRILGRPRDSYLTRELGTLKCHFLRKIYVATTLEARYARANSSLWGCKRLRY
jgi:hypothetical protein